MCSSDLRRDDQGQPGQESRRQLVAERFALSGWHDRHRIAPSQHGPHNLLLARSKLFEAELVVELSGQIIHGEIIETMDCWRAWMRREYRGPTHCGQVERAEMGRSTLDPQVRLRERWLGDRSNRRTSGLGKRCHHPTPARSGSFRPSLAKS